MLSFWSDPCRLPLANLKRDNLDWQGHRLMIYGKGGPYGSRTKRRIVPLTARLQPLIEGHLAIHESLEMSVRTIQRIVKRVANRARISLQRHRDPKRDLPARPSASARPRPAHHHRDLPQPLPRGGDPRISGEMVKRRERDP